MSKASVQRRMRLRATQVLNIRLWPSPPTIGRGDGHAKHIIMDKVMLMSISAMLGAGWVAYHVFEAIKKSTIGIKTSRYVALASLTAIPTYATVIYDFGMQDLGVRTINKSIGFALWAVIFSAAALAFGRYADSKGRHQDDGDAPSQVAKHQTSQAATGGVAGERMSDEQRRTLCYSLVGLAVLLIAIFIRIGSRLDYGGSTVILELSTVNNPNRWYPGQPDTFAWGVLVRLGEFGIVMGVLLPSLFLIAAVVLGKNHISRT